jgi:signal transduction histidine kinase
MTLAVIVSILLLLIYYIKKSHRINQEKRLQEQRFETEMKDMVYESEIRFMENNLALEEAIRTRIGRDLHDHLGNRLAAAQVTLETIEARLMKDPGYCAEKLVRAIDLINQACNDVRSLSHDLVAEELTNNSLNSALKTLCDTVVVPETGIEVLFNAIGEPFPMSMAIKKNILATIGILVDNTMRHAQASQLSLQLFYFHDSLNITLDDNGIGITETDNHEGIGLKNAQKRIKQLGGIFEINSRKNDGTSISISIPVDHG